VKFDVESEMPVRDATGLCVLCEAGRTRRSRRAHQGRRRHNYTGYADKAASERKILRDVVEKGDSWFRTGDLMRQDKDGYFYFVDRIGDTFRWKGENVSTTEVAEVISRYPGVDEANVYGVKIGKLDGRAGMAAITPGEGSSSKDCATISCDELPSYARPLFIRITPAIETTGTFKFRKVDLVRDGFDPAKIEQTLYFDDPTEASP
jgi:fatty-acyl-CoA synthase